MRSCLRWSLLAIALAAPVYADEQAKTEAASKADDTLSAIVHVRSKIVADARSAPNLGLQREGSGVLVRDGYVATIGYLVIEAESVVVTAADGKSVPAIVAGYDHASGFGLLKLLAPLAGKPLPLGDADALTEREAALVASYGGRDGVSLAYVVSRRPFSGSWEYQLDSAIFTYPAVRDWSGAALINVRSELVGIGSLIVSDAAGGGTPSPGNMFVPVSLLRPILEELIASGRRSGPVPPWLGLNTEEMRGRLFVSRVSPDGPAERAGLRSGDIVVAVGGEDVSSLAELYRKIWSRGAAGVEVPLTVLQGTQVRQLTVKSMDRLDYFRQKPTY